MAFGLCVESAGSRAYPAHGTPNALTVVGATTSAGRPSRPPPPPPLPSPAPVPWAAVTDADETGQLLHPRRGPHQAHAGTPARRPASLRRTTTHTSERPDGPLGDVHLIALGRDLWTGPDGSAETIDRAALDATIAFTADRALRDIRSEPPADALAALSGRRVGSGFRRALDKTLPDEDRTASLRYQLLDDLPTAVLVSGYAMGAAGLHPPTGSFKLTNQADICAGWATGATILVETEARGRVPQSFGPAAPPLTAPTDPDAPIDPEAWHEVPPLGPHAMRRWRRTDVWRNEPGGPVQVEAFFRDSHMDQSGRQTVVHEYLVTAELDPVTLVFRSCQADIGALPWMECPSAAASAGRLVGTTPGDLRARVAQTFTGTSTCTHLNDTLRSLAALPYLAGFSDTSFRA